MALRLRTKRCNVTGLFISLNSPSHVRHHYACAGQIGCKITYFLPNGQTASGLKFNIKFEVVVTFAFAAGKVEAVLGFGPFSAASVFGCVGLGELGRIIKGNHKLFEVLAI